MYSENVYRNGFEPFECNGVILVYWFFTMFQMEGEPREPREPPRLGS